MRRGRRGEERGGEGRGGEERGGEGRREEWGASLNNPGNLKSFCSTYNTYLLAHLI